MQRVSEERTRYRTTDKNSQTAYTEYAAAKFRLMTVDERAAYERLRERLVSELHNFGISSADALLWPVIAFLNEKGVK